jgi:hypothetical protein
LSVAVTGSAVIAASACGGGGGGSSSTQAGGSATSPGTGSSASVLVASTSACTVYAGSQLIGSGSNAKIENGQDTQPGFVCNTANHGNSVTGAPGFQIPAFQAGLVNTIVYSVGR